MAVVRGRKKFSNGNRSKTLRMTWPGSVNIDIIQATEVPAADFDGKSDPYVLLHCGKWRKQTKTKKNCLTPVWNESLFTLKNYHNLVYIFHAFFFPPSSRI